MECTCDLYFREGYPEEVRRLNPECPEHGKHKEEHVLDGPLGDIHETALLLQMNGLTEAALKLAKAHEAIEKWVLEHDNLERTSWLARQVIDSLPQKRDWLDPALEAELKDLAEEYPSAGL
jgi:hypothetical protein